MDMRGALSAASLKAIEQLGRSPVHRSRKKKAPGLPFILGVIQSVGCDTIYVEDAQGMVVQGLVIAHWTKEELAMIQSAIENNEFMYRKTWRNTQAVVITC